MLMIISTDVGKVPVKIPYPFMMKTPSTLQVEGNFLNLIRTSKKQQQALY